MKWGKSTTIAWGWPSIDTQKSVFQQHKWNNIKLTFNWPPITINPCLLECHMLLFGKNHSEYISYIFAYIYVVVVDCLVFVQIMTIVIPNPNACSKILYHTHCNENKSAPIATHDWQQW